MYYGYVDNESEKKAIQLKEEDKTKETAESKRKKLQMITDSEQSRQTQEAERRAKEAENRASESDRKFEEAVRRAEKAERRADEADRRAEDADRRSDEAERRAEDEHRRAEEADRRAKEAGRRAEEAERRAEDEHRRAEEADRRAKEAGRRAEEAERRAEDEHRMAEQGSQIAEEANSRRAEEAIIRIGLLTKAYDEQWVVRREDIELTCPGIGRSGWATVSVAKFRGAQVAVKRIHNQIVSRHNEDLFRREMQMAARLRHPNLVLFIGATLEGDMMILMELMPTSLRRQIEADEYITPKLVKHTSLDIVRALNHLHKMKPDPMIHRDISSANVLLEPLLPPKYWKAKVTDYGSVNLVRQLHTENPGSPAYSAPEAAIPSQQTPKMDIYSFGVLMLEMLTGEMRAPEHRSSLFHHVHHRQLLRVIQRCLSEGPMDRPSAEDIMSELL